MGTSVNNETILNNDTKMSLIDIVYNQISTLGHPIKYIYRPDLVNGVAMSYHFYNDSHAIYGDGDGKDFVASLQVDIFYRKDIKDLDRQIIKLLKDRNFKYSDSSDYEDEIGGTRLYHKALTFNYLESEVQNA